MAEIVGGNMMIDNMHYTCEDGALISYSVDGTEKTISFDEVSQIWSGLTEDDVEGGRAYVWDEFIAFSVLVASGQGGVFFVWDTATESFVHYSECPYFVDAVRVNDDIIILCEVSNFVTPYHVEVYEVPFGTRDRREMGVRVYSEHPEEYHSSSPGGLKLQYSDNRLEILDDDGVHLYSSDVRNLRNHKPRADFSDLYKDYGNGLDPCKLVYKSMIT